MVVYGAEVCGQLFDGAIWFCGVTGDRGSGGVAFQCGANPFSGVANHARGSMAQVLRELEYRSRIKSPYWLIQHLSKTCA